MARPNPYAKRPGNQYQCTGCWLFGRQRVTTFFVGGGYKDGQTPSKLSWWITANENRVINLPQDAEALYKILLRPPLKFVLSFVEGKDAVNYLQMALPNNHPEIKASTPLTFTINNTPYCYSVYELEAALTSPEDLAGAMPGVRELIRLLGPYKPLIKPTDLEKGRPAGSETLPNENKKLVTATQTSGFPTVAPLKVDKPAGKK